MSSLICAMGINDEFLVTDWISCNRAKFVS